jgi:hypothetical protein
MQAVKLTPQTPRRRGAILVFSAMMLVLVFAFVAFTVDVGYMALAQGELQNAADSAALAGVLEMSQGEAAVKAEAKAYALKHRAAGGNVVVPDADVLLGKYNFTTKVFTADPVGANAVRVITRVTDKPFFFAPVIGHAKFTTRAQATAMLNPRDIVFVVDTSGSMNDDTEPQWATKTINGLYGPSGYPNVATELIQDLYSDLNFGTYPGALEHIGQTLGVPSDYYAYAEMTKDDGALADASIASTYRILVTDDEATRRVKAYSWIIDNQIARLMPNARPIPNSQTSYGFWEKYIDYVITYVGVGTAPPPPPDDGSGGGGGGGGGGGPSDPPPPSPPLGSRARKTKVYASYGAVAPIIASVSTVAGYVPYTSSGSQPGVPRLGSTLLTYVPVNYDGDNFWGYNNPNTFTFSSPDWTDMSGGMDKIGYLTYVQFLQDFGRDRSPDVATGDGNAQPGVGTKTQLSTASNYCAYHDEATAGGTFSFPPREQPMHACRRSLIAALQVVKEQNAGLASGGDRVAVITFDALSADHAPVLVRSLTNNYTNAMQSCTQLQAVSDIGATTAIEAGLIAARNHLKKPAEGGTGRHYAKKVIVLLTDGVPNAWQSSTSSINSYIGANPNADYYSNAYPWLNSALVQAARIEEENTVLYSVGIGLGTDYNFMDRMARTALTDKAGKSPRGSGNPAEYEARLTAIFEEIIKNPGGRMVD